MQMPSNLSQSHDVDMYHQVDDIDAALAKYLHQGYSIAVESFPTDDGMFAVLQGENGTRLGILERPIEANQAVRN